MLLVGGGEGDALSGIQNITIIMAAPFAVVMVLLCVALARDLRSDPLVRRGLRSTAAIEQAVEFGQRTYGDAVLRARQAAPDHAAGERRDQAEHGRALTPCHGRRTGTGGPTGTARRRHAASGRRPGAAHDTPTEQLGGRAPVVVARRGGSRPGDPGCAGHRARLV